MDCSGCIFGYGSYPVTEDSVFGFDIGNYVHRDFVLLEIYREGRFGEGLSNSGGTSSW